MRSMIRLLGAASIAAMLAVTPAAAAIATFTYDGHLDSWTAPKFGLYAVTAWGASGGGGSLSGLTSPYVGLGGRGVGLRAFFLLGPAQSLTIAVGGQGLVGSDSGGGGGGSFVVRGGQALVVAGGGGGGSNEFFWSGGDATVSPSGGGSGGAGGGSDCCGEGGGGGGFTSAGGVGDPVDFWRGGGGGGFPNLAGGAAGVVYAGAGGFGGGGGGGWCGGGGGGGYSGGAGGGCWIGDGAPGEGGTSFSAAQVTQVLGYRDLYQDGLVQIMPIPEPSSWALLIAGFGFIGVALRRLRGRPALKPAN